MRDITSLLRDVIYAGFLQPEELPDFTSFTTQNLTEDYWSQELRLVNEADLVSGMGLAGTGTGDRAH